MDFSELHYRLCEPFPEDRIKWRVGSTNKDKTKGMALAYIDARDVMERLDEVVGAGNWGDRYSESCGVIVCTISVLIDGEWVSKSDGAGQTDFEGAKGGMSDAFKRAAVKWGIGRYLYDLGAEWVPIEPMGRSYKISKPPALPPHAKAQSHLHRLNFALEQAGYTETDAKRAKVKKLVNRPLQTTKHLSRAELFYCIDALNDEIDAKIQAGVDATKDGDPAEQFERHMGTHDA